jgi:hypothetical protein
MVTLLICPTCGKRKLHPDDPGVECHRCETLRHEIQRGEHAEEWELEADDE